MHAPNILNKIEISFWDRAIPLMTESKTVQSFIRQTYQYLEDPRKARWIPAAILLSAGFGLGLGYVMGSLGLAIR
ncbi:MAG TPA: hypothetical protein VMT46_18840 [Anaerolineaceae bacterium]|nr:hypothetical protein [Anaerolineaceae bacterium]